MNHFILEDIINKKLNCSNNIISDFSLYNGLQVEGKREVNHIVTGVTACYDLFHYAANLQADAIIVHHGIFWRNSPCVIQGMRYRRLKLLLEKDINLYAWHYPLDVHLELGNNVQFANLLDIKILGVYDCLMFYGEFVSPITSIGLFDQLINVFKSDVFHYGKTAKPYIKNIAWCTGKGQDFIEQSVKFGVDAFISGEVSEKTIYFAHEMNLNFYSIGHYASEKYGVISLGDWLRKEYNFIVTFADIFNPI